MRLLFIIVIGLSSAAQAEDYQVPHLPWGAPDFQGNWHNKTATPFQRPEEFGDRLTLSMDEAKAMQQRAEARVAKDAKPTDPDAPPPEAKPLPPVGNYNLFWTDRGMKPLELEGKYRTSMIIDPPDGQMPPLTESAKARVKNRRGPNRNDGPEGRSLGERCLLSFGSLAGPPMLPTMYNAHYTIVQSPGHVMIMAEMVHDARIVPIGEDLEHDPRLSWMGSSIGHWEGDTLVIETTNFREEQSFRGSTPSMVVTERLTRVAEDKIRYQFTLEDPKAFTKPVTAELAFKPLNDRVYEYACHEGNYGLPGILAGARREERQAAEQQEGDK